MLINTGSSFYICNQNKSIENPIPTLVKLFVLILIEIWVLMHWYNFGLCRQTKQNTTKGYYFSIIPAFEQLQHIIKSGTIRSNAWYHVREEGENCGKGTQIQIYSRESPWLRRFLLLDVVHCNLVLEPEPDPYRPHWKRFFQSLGQNGPVVYCSLLFTRYLVVPKHFLIVLPFSIKY